MGGRVAGSLLREVGRLFGRGTVAGLNEGQLLDRFVAQRDEAAFAALVARHGPMVLGVCRRHLRDERDVEDAFQATFLVLVRRAAAIRDRDLVAHWLHGVAHRVAVRTRAHSARRHAHEGVALDDRMGPAHRPAAPDHADLRSVLDEELARLPGALRAPLVLCYLEGLTHDEAARRLGWPVGTVRSRMARGRDRLRHRLARRGVTATGAALITAGSSEAVPAALLDSAVRMSLAFAARQGAATAAASAAATTLAQGVIDAMALTKIQVLGGTALAGLLVVGGMQTFGRQLGGMGPGTAQNERQAALIRSVDKIQASLVESARRNAELQKELQDLRGELETLRGGPARGMMGGGTSGGRAEGGGPMGMGGYGPGFVDKGEEGMGYRPNMGVGFMGFGPGMGGAGMMSGGGGGEAGMPGMGGAGGGGGSMAGMPGGRGGLGGSGMGGSMGGAAGKGSGRGRGPTPGMMGMMGGTKGTLGDMVSAPRREGPQYQRSGNLILAASTQGDRVSAIDTTTGKSQRLRLSDAEGAPQVAKFSVNGYLIALDIEGEAIRRLGVYDGNTGVWMPIALGEPFSGHAKPWNRGNLVAYGLGRTLIVYDGTTQAAYTQTLPEGVEAPNPPSAQNDTIEFVHDGHIYIYVGGSGAWRDIDTRALLESPDETPEDRDR